jgi:predicted DNA-binding transcriptional regulator AlpA
MKMPLALRYPDAAEALGISQATLRRLVEAGRVHRPYKLPGNIVLFDARQLQEDWDRLKVQFAEQADVTNPWDDLLGQ